jgi:hypothetical protein
MRPSDLVPDCGRCAAVCCVATAFDASEDFAFAKPANAPCKNLTRDCRCAIHDELVPRGMSGCAVYDCYGAGQRVTRAFADPDERNAAFMRLRVAHELLWLLAGALPLAPPSLAADIARAVEALGRIDVDARPLRAPTHALLRRVGRSLTVLP